jgi:hypothetical protein
MQFARFEPGQGVAGVGAGQLTAIDTRRRHTETETETEIAPADGGCWLWDPELTQREREREREGEREREREGERALPPLSLSLGACSLTICSLATRRSNSCTAQCTAAGRD